MAFAGLEFRILDPFFLWQPQTQPFGFRILDFGTRFGFCIRLLLLHADSGRRIYVCLIRHA